METRDGPEPRWQQRHLTTMVVLAALLIGAVLTGCQPPNNPPPTPLAEPLVAREFTASVYPFPGVFIANSSPDKAVPPTRPPGDPAYPPGSRYPVGLNAGFYLSSNDGGNNGVWDTAPKGCTATWCTTSNINWGPIDRAIRLTAANTVTLGSGRVISAPVILNLPPLMMNNEIDGSCGSASDPCVNLYLPTWMEGYREVFQNTQGSMIDPQGVKQVSNWWYNTVDYGDPVFRARLKQFLTEAAARYNDDPRVLGIRLVAGFQGETQPNKREKNDVGTEQALLASHEQIISCDTYKRFVREVSEHAYSVFTRKPVYVMTGPAPCSNYSSEKWRYELLYDPVTGWEVVSPKKLIGFSLNRDDADAADTDEYADNIYADYRFWSIGPTMYALGRPMVWEAGGLPFHRNTDGDPWAYQVWRFYGVAGAGGDSVFNPSSWQTYMSQLSWDVLDHWMGRQPQRLWLVFRNAEWPTYNYAAGRGESGYLGVWGNWLDLLDTDTYEQACNRTLYTIARTRAAALSSKPSNTLYRVPCDSLLPVPAITPQPTAQDGADMLNRTFNRQSLVLSSTGPESEMDIALVDGHPATGQVKDLAVTVSYLDRGTDRFYLTFPLATGATRQYIVTKTGTNLWQRASFAVPSVKLENRLAGARGPAFIVITNDSNPQQEFLHEVYADISEPAATPTPTRTATATPSRTHTPTATASRTLTPSITPTPTRTATATPSRTHTPTATASHTLTPSITPTPTRTATATPSRTHTPTATASRTLTPSATAAIPVTPTQTPAATFSPTITATAAPSRTATSTATSTPSVTPAAPATRTPTQSPTATTPGPQAACMPRVQTTIPIGDGPKSVAASTDGFFTGLYANNQLVRTLPGGSVAWEAATGPGGTNGVALWDKIAITTNRDRGTITLHDAISGARLRDLSVGGLPWGVAAANGRGYVANFGASTVSVIDLVEQKVLATVPVGLYPVSVAAGPDGAYVVHLDGSVTQLDSQGRILARASTDAPDARGIAWDAIRERLYIGSREGHIVALNARTLQPVSRFDLPGPAYGLIVNPGTGRLYAVDAVNDRLYMVEPDGSGIAQIVLPAQNASDGGMGIAAWNNRIVVTNYDAGSLTFVDDTTCAERLTPTAAPVVSTATPTTSATSTASATATSTATPTATVTPSPTAAPTVTRTATVAPSPTSTATATPTATVTFSPTATHTASATASPSRTPTATATRTRTPTLTSTRTPTATATAETIGPRPTPAAIRAKIEIVWPHGGAPVREADLANITAYLISETNGTASSLPEPPACDWDPTVKLWAALNAQPARPVSVGQKRMATIEGRTFPVWDFNDVDVSAARDPANKLTFFATVDGVRTLHNVWTHAADARTVFPQTDVPTGTISRSPLALDGRIEIVWPHDNLPPEQATLANITAYLFALDTLQAIGPDASWTPTVRLHWSLNAEAEKLPGTGIVGVPRTITASNGVKFQAWDFNDVDISAANETLNRLYFWVSADDVVTFPNVWAHGVDARTVFPQPDVLNDCR